MKKNKAHLLMSLAIATLLSVGASSGIYAQKDGGQVNPNRCGTQVPDAQWEAWMQEKVNELNQQRIMQGTETQVVNYTIPVIFHILHNQGSVTAENISAAQVNSQIVILNNDYAGTNSDVGSIPSTFQSVKAGNTGIQFCLAKTDPSGALLAESGIERINWNTRGWTDPNTFTSAATLQSYFDGTVKPNSIWDPTKYLNIWVAKVNGSGLLGYASFPAGTGLTGLSGVENANTCGVVLNQSAVGNVGTAAAPYNGGRTATHEIGHWLGLRHIWGDGTCATDYCNDTPSAETSNYNCQTHPYNTAAAGGCTGNTTGEMFMNYMDYVPDACMYMFTLDQTTRMQTTMANGTYRIGLNTSGKCNNPVSLDAGISSIIAPVAGSSGCNNSVTPKVVITNAGTTTLTSATITYNMDGGTNQVYNWTGSLTTGSTATVTLNAYTGLSVATHTFSATTSSPNGGADGFAGNNNMTATFTVTSSTGTGLPFTEGFQNTTFVPTGWSYTAPNAPYSWARVTTAGGFGASTASARMDNYTSPSNMVGQKDAMRTPLLTFAAANSTLNLKFDVAYAAYNATLYDSLNVWISTDCGSTWARIYNKGNTTLSTATTTTVSFVPTAAQWRTETVNLGSYAGQSSVYLKFESVSGWGNNLYLDNINISYTASSIPTANFTTSATKCAGQPITFTDASTNTPTSWSWSTTPSTGVTINTATSQNPTITFATAGTYTVSHTATNGSGTSPSYTQAIVVNATPSMTSATTANVCSGSAASLALTSSVASGYSWIAAANANVSGESTTAQATSTINNTLTITSGTTNQTVTYSVTPTATTGGCVGATQTVSVTVIPLPTVSNATTANGCSGSALNIPLTASAPSSFSWIAAANANVSGESTTAQATGTINNTVTITTGTVTQNVTYSITPTSTTGGCVGPVKTMTVTINPLPSMTSGTTTNICSGVAMNFALTSNITSTYSWLTSDNANTTGESTTAQTNASINNTITSTATTNQALTYSVTPTSAAGCAGTVQNVTVTVRPAPTMTSASAASICSGTAVGLALTSNLASTYSWIAANNANTSGESTTAQTTTIINNTLTVTSGTSAQVVTYSVTPTATAAGNCVGPVQTVSVTVTPAPSMTSVNTATVCSGSAVSLPLTASVPSSFSWIAANNANTTGESTTAQSGSTISNTITITSGGNQNVTYSVTPTSTAGSCLGTVQTVTVTVRALPTVTASSTPASGAVCAGSQVTLTGGGASTYTWTGGASNGVAFTPASSLTYTVTGTDVNGCTNTATKAVTVNALPTVTAGSTPASGAVCAGSQITLTGGGATTYTWTGGASNGVAFTPASSLTYTVTGTDANGCTNTATKAVTVNALPNVTVNSPSTCSGAPVTLTAAGASTYSWSTSATGSSTSVSPTSNTSYTVTGTDANGCVNTAVSNVTITSAPNVTANSVSICIGQQAVLTGSGASTYSWSNGDATATTTVTPTSTTSYTVTGANGPGCTNTAVATVTVNSLPDASIATPSVIDCSNPTVTLTGSSTATGASYQWTSGPATATYAVSTAGSYTLTVTDANGCNATATTNVTSNTAQPNVSIAPPAQLTCTTTTVMLTGSSTTPGAAYQWTSGPATANNSVSTAGTYTLTVTDPSNGCTNTAMATVSSNTVAPNVTANSSAAGTVCGGTSVTLTANGASTYVWDDSSTNSTNNVSPTTTTTYSVTGTDVNGCTGTASVTVNVFAPNTPTVSQAGTTLTSSPAVSYQWYFNGNPIVGETNQTLNVTQNGNYTVETVDANGCTNTSSGFTVANIGIRDVVLNASISIFPNPNEGNFTVKGTVDSKSEYTLELRNTLGQLIQSETIKNTSSINRAFALKANDAGVYFIIIRNNEGASSVHRVIVQ
jgi:zinc-dependent metalloproteinase lipoprotein